MSPIQFPTKRIFTNFGILKINRMISLCNLFMERPSYYYYYCYCRHCCHYVAMATADEVLLLVACVCHTVC